MKKMLLVLLAVPLLIVLVSCGSEDPAPSSNIIGIASLSAEQQEILDLLSVPNSQEVLIFDFSTDDSFRRVEFWVEVYNDGELVDRPAGLTTMLDTTGSQSGLLAVTISRNPHYRWTLSAVSGSTRSSHVSSAESKVNPSLARAIGSIDEQVVIEDRKEIILHSALFTTGSINIYDHQTLQERPELLNEYLYAHIIKCMFST